MSDLIAPVRQCDDPGVRHLDARVSVIVPTHNRPQLLAEALSSIEAQSFTDWEAIIVDDASDIAVDCVTDRHVSPRIRVMRHETSRGGAAAKNAGVAVARGDYLAFLDDDDLFHSDYLSQAV